MFDLVNEGQGHWVEHSQWFHSMANINLYESQTWAFFASSHRFRDVHISKCLTVKILVKVIDYSIRSYPTRWRISTCIKVIRRIFAVASTVSEILILYTFELWHFYQGHVVEKWYLRCSIANVNLHNSHKKNLCASYYRWRAITI